MPLINSIPERYEDGFKELSEINDDDFLKIKDSLSKVPLTSSIDKLNLYISHSNSFESVYIEDILSSVGSIIPFIESENMIEEIIENITIISEITDLVKPDKKEVFRERLTFLLKNEQIYYASKTEDLINDYGNVFISCRMISDIRTVFDLNVENIPKAGVIIHNLNIHYQSNEEPFHKSISLILDSAAIKSLKDALIRSENKEKSLSKIFEKSGVEKLND